MFDHRDNIHERLVVPGRVRAPEILLGEMLRRGRELLAQFGQRVSAPVLRTAEKNADCLDALGIVAHKALELREVVLGPVFVACAIANKNAGDDFVATLVGDNEMRPRALVIH